ncbi:MAG: AtpZ/AtpI family protein [Planctomycetes bacterium]|jgi:F0F1-type ATP synthase assembly protein I|nr:AtpZ/AtpI family protein [Planctomycetota bacterium]
MESNLEKKAWWQEPLRTFFRLSTWIVFPVVIGALIGKWLDNKYQSEPKWFLIIIGVSFAVSLLGLVRGTLQEYKKIEKQNPVSKIEKASHDSIEKEKEKINNL